MVSAYGLRHQVGDDVFQDLLQIHPGHSLVFVIDITATMDSDLTAIVAKTREIVSETLDQPANYILVTGNEVIGDAGDAGDAGEL
jgi:hypothetical protein